MHLEERGARQLREIGCVLFRFARGCGFRRRERASITPRKNLEKVQHKRQRELAGKRSAI